ncbi:helix-turn-helix transcriptional regulator [Ferruginibacter sp. HRS2-29]|uniref:helix-turn-helix domain-containing protein n=1 Tax=Ferruginibacter sp. HRS2-29 TaxID=2487334 RepID=UPI0020CFB714|nr:helix-turn-helix transcriptional regulator [Ferruginibacter sp. HRS2-29]MCP9750504.1 XRE family transcriptional regulator [Ferruginibacter sp. HRS2-29]
MSTKKNKKTTSKLRAKELASNFVFPAELSPEDKKNTDAELKKILAKRRASKSDKEILRTRLLQIRFRMEEYIKDSHFDKTKTFGYFLKDYISSLNKKRQEFALEINIKPTVLSQYINNHREPPPDIFIRLEIHSNKKIPAVSWYRLMEKENIHALDKNATLRAEQQKFVTKKAY